MTPPKTTILNTQALHPPIHHANGILPGPSPAAEAANPRVAVVRTVGPVGLVAVLTVLHLPPLACCVSQACLARPRSCRSAVKAAVRRVRSAAAAIAFAVLPRLPPRHTHGTVPVNFSRLPFRIGRTEPRRRAPGSVLAGRGLRPDPDPDEHRLVRPNLDRPAEEEDVTDPSDESVRV